MSKSARTAILLHRQAEVIDTAGRVERFTKKYADAAAKVEAAKSRIRQEVSARNLVDTITAVPFFLSLSLP